MHTLPIINKANTAALLASVLLALAVVGTPALAADKKADKQPQLPINIQSNNASFNQNTGRSVYQGNVELKRGGLTLTGNKLVLTHTRKRGQLHAVLTGSPAHIDKQPDQNGSHAVTGHSKEIVFDNPAHTVTMQGEAYLKRADGNSVRGKRIVHNLETDRTQAQGGGSPKGRVKVILQPGSQSDNNSQ